jgi:hypothetical protein
MAARIGGEAFRSANRKLKKPAKMPRGSPVRKQHRRVHLPADERGPNIAPVSHGFPALARAPHLFAANSGVGRLA